jgi:hypothetical protein
MKKKTQAPSGSIPKKASEVAALDSQDSIEVVKPKKKEKVVVEEPVVEAPVAPEAGAAEEPTA